MRGAVSDKADMILTGCAVYSGRLIEHENAYIAIKGNKILAVGNGGEIEQYCGDTTEIRSFPPECLIVPGLHDCHVHVIQAGLMDKYAVLYDAHSPEETAKIAAKQAASAASEEEWWMGFGFRIPSWPKGAKISRKLLDRAIGNRPVILFDEELHAAWLNSRALRTCHIDASTAVPQGGTIVRDEHGEPTGELLDTAISLATRYAFAFTHDEVRDLAQRYLHNTVSMGITSISDMTPYLNCDLSFPDVYLDMASNHSLQVRVNAALNLLMDIDQFEMLRGKAEKEGRGMYRIPFMKQFLDGTPGNYTGYLLEDYSDQPGTRGSLNLEYEVLKNAVDIATAHNVSVKLHSCGDASCRVALDVYEKARRRHPGSSSRHAVEHIEVIDPADIPRFAELQVIASVQPEHLAAGEMHWEENAYPQRLGPERTRYTWPFRRMQQAGAVLCGGSDCPVVTGNPFWGIYVGNTRKYYDGLPEEGWNPEEKLSVRELIDMYTKHAAYAESREHELGILEPGMLADIAVLDRNLFQLEGSTEIRNTQVLLTMVNGEVAYEK